MSTITHVESLETQIYGILSAVVFPHPSPKLFEERMVDADGTLVKIATLPNQANLILISLHWSCYESQLQSMSMAVLEREYGSRLVQPEQGFDVSVELDLARLPLSDSERDRAIRNVALIKRHVIGGLVENVMLGLKLPRMFALGQTRDPLQQEQELETMTCVADVEAAIDSDVIALLELKRSLASLKPLKPVTGSASSLAKSLTSLSTTGTVPIGQATAKVSVAQSPSKVPVAQPAAPVVVAKTTLVQPKAQPIQPSQPKQTVPIAVQKAFENKKTLVHSTESLSVKPLPSSIPSKQSPVQAVRQANVHSSEIDVTLATESDLEEDDDDGDYHRRYRNKFLF